MIRTLKEATQPLDSLSFAARDYAADQTGDPSIPTRQLDEEDAKLYAELDESIEQDAQEKLKKELKGKGKKKEADDTEADTDDEESTDTDDGDDGEDW